MRFHDADVGDDEAMDVARAAWLGAGAPRPGTVNENGEMRRCARCARSGSVTAAVSAVVSKRFTAFDTWRNPGGHFLCETCTWLYRTPALRLTPLFITRDPVTMTHLDSRGAGHVLAGPLPAESALVVPLHPGRKHLLPTARWDRVTIDDATLAWTEQDVGRLAALQRLRSVGFGPHMLRRPAPEWSILQRLPHETWPDIDHDWRTLATWRTRPLWLDLALAVTVVGDRAEAA